MIRIVPIEPSPDPGLLAWLVRRLEGRFETEVRRMPVRRVAGRSSNDLVDALISIYPQEGWTLAVTAADLHAPGRDHIFGEAALGGSWAVVSTARLGTPERILREALHEFGHLAGLGHCPDPACLMAPAVRVEDIDARGDRFCAACRNLELHLA